MGYSRKVLEIEKNSEKKLLYAFLIEINKKKKNKQSEWLPSNTLLIFPLFPCQVEGPRSNVLTNIRGECGHCAPLPRRIPHPQGDITRALGVAPFSSTPVDWNCSSQHLSVVQREELVTGTFISDTGHLQAVKNTSCQISALNQVGKRISILNYQHTGKYSVFGAAAYCVSCDWHQQPLSDCEPMTKIPSLFTLK